MSSVDARLNELKSRLTVTAPYYAFSRVYADEKSDGIYGDFIPEQPVDGECAAISVAEAGRHIAILGTLLGELLTDSQVPAYYLAVEAEVSVASDLEPIRMELREKKREAMTAYVRCIDNSTTRLKVEGLLTHENRGLLKIIVSYVRLNEVQFRFLYRDSVFPDLPHFNTASDSPWSVPVPLSVASEIKSGILSATINSHDPMLCAGHFNNYPMWPVAIVMSAATQLITTLLRQIYGSELRYLIRHASMQAKKLLSVKEVISFHAEIINHHSDGVNVRCLMKSSDSDVEVAELRANLIIYN